MGVIYPYRALQFKPPSAGSPTDHRPLSSGRRRYISSRARTETYCQSAVEVSTGHHNAEHEEDHHCFRQQVHGGHVCAAAAPAA
eukprot:1179762-Prorocentrum_minimum.AAC.2